MLDGKRFSATQSAFPSFGGLQELGEQASAADGSTESRPTTCSVAEPKFTAPNGTLRSPFSIVHRHPAFDFTNRPLRVFRDKRMRIGRRGA